MFAMVKSHEMKSQNYFRVTTIATIRLNVNFGEMDTERSTGKNDGF